MNAASVLLAERVKLEMRHVWHAQRGGIKAHLASAVLAVSLVHTRPFMAVQRVSNVHLAPIHQRQAL